MHVEIRLAYRDIEKIRTLFLEYADALNVDLDFQSFTEELDNLPAEYSLPRGRLYIATCGGEAAGCIAIRPIDSARCEMKRLYVRPRFRRMGLGEKLARKVILDAVSLNYRQMYLDTLSSLKSAVSLYKKLGFYETSPYYDNPLEGVLYFCLDLDSLAVK